MSDRTDRAERLAAQLRANLVRRKQQARAGAAAAQSQPPPGDQRESASDPSDVAAPAAS